MSSGLAEPELINEHGGACNRISELLLVHLTAHTE